MATTRLSESSENIIKYLSVTDNGKLKWNASFESLKVLMNNLLEIQTTWTLPGGDCRQLEHGNSTLRWYSKSNSLTITGEGSEDLKSQLRMIINLNTSDTLTSEALSYTGEKSEGDYSDAENDEGVITANQNNQATTVSVFDHIRSIEERLERKIEMLVHEVQDMKSANLSEALNDAPQQDEYKASLVKENTTLKKENAELAEQVNNYKFIVTDMKAKIKDLENEKNSLITVIRILQEDQKQDESNAWNTVGRQKKIPVGLQNNPCRTDDTNANANVNRYSILSETDKDNEVSEVTHARIPNDKDKDIPTGVNNSQAERPENATTRGPSRHPASARSDIQSTHPTQTKIAILGDSMLKHLNTKRMQAGLRDHKVTIKTFPGAGIEEMKHYMVPTLATNPDKLIVHIGTNDLHKTTTSNLIRSMESLGKSIKDQDNNIDLIWSEIITRSDDHKLADKVNIVNKELNKLCEANNWGLIKNDNITRNLLNNSRLHLNKEGTSTLAKNIKQYIKGDYC
jgi:hypothetical protein